MSTELVVRNEAVPALVEEPAVLASRAPDPVAAIEFASQCASLLKGVLLKQRLITRISGNDHVQAEGWTLLAAMTGYSPRVAWSRKVDPAIGDGWEACVELVDAYGRTVSAAEAMALKDEGAKWSRQEYSVRSMAQTRATSRAIRLKLGYIVTMAGYSATAAEEMPAGPEPPAPGRMAPTPAGGRVGAASATRPPASSAIPGAPSAAGNQGEAGSSERPATASPPDPAREAWRRLFRDNGVESPTAAQRDHVKDVLQVFGVSELDQLLDPKTFAHVWLAARAQLGGSIGAYTREASGSFFETPVPSSTEGFYSVTLRPDGKHRCTCRHGETRRRNQPATCGHVDVAMDFLREYVGEDPYARRDFSALLGLEEPPPSEEEITEGLAALAGETFEQPGGTA